MFTSVYSRWYLLAATLFVWAFVCASSAPVALSAPSANPELWPHDVPDDVLNKEAIKDLRPGMKIDKSNWELIKDLLPPTTVEPIKRGERVIQIGSGHTHAVGTKNYLEESRKNLKRAKLNPDGTIQGGWIAGLTFPEIDPKDPQAGLKAMWNWQTRPIGDDEFLGGIHFTASRGGVEIKSFGIDNSTLDRPAWGLVNWFGRTDVPPVPTVPNNPEGVYQTSLIIMDRPIDQKDNMLLFYRYKEAFTDPDYHVNKGDDMYAYVPSVRRVRRITAAQRTDSFGGSDVTYDDLNGYLGTVLENTYKLLGREFQLMMWQPPEEWERKWGEGTLYTPAPNLNIPYEVRLTYKVEAKHKDPNYIYSKRVLWLDAEAWFINMELLFDRAGEHWKTFNTAAMMVKPTHGDGSGPVLSGSIMYDHQNNRATMTMSWGNGYNLGLKTSTFRLEGLRKKGR